jgi:hypothetical protein
VVAGNKVVEDFAGTAFGQHLLVLAEDIPFQFIHRRTSLLLPERVTVLHPQILLPCLPFHRIKYLHPEQHFLNSGFIMVSACSNFILAWVRHPTRIKSSLCSNCSQTA